MFAFIVSFAVPSAPSLTSVREVCDELEIKRGSLPDARIGTSQTAIAESDLEWILDCRVVERDGLRSLGRDTEQAQEVHRAEQDRANLLREQWKREFKRPLSFPSVESFIQVACETEARKENLFLGAQAQFRKLLASSVVDSFPVVDCFDNAPYQIVRAKPDVETFAFLKQVARADSEWSLQGRNAGLAEPVTLQLQSYYQSVKGDSVVALLSNTPQGQLAILEFQDGDWSVGSESAYIKFEAPSAEPVLTEMTQGGSNLVRWPLGEYLSVPYVNRDRAIATEALNWPIWISSVIEEATGKEVIGWYPDRVASELVIGAGRFTQTKVVRKSDVLNLVERWCEVHVVDDRILVRPRWIAWEESMLLEAKTWEKAGRDLSPHGTLTPTELGRIALENKEFGRGHPAEAILGMLGEVPIAPFQVGTFFALAAAVDGLDQTRVGYPRLSLNLRNKLASETLSLRFSALRKKRLRSDDASIRSSLAGSSFWLDWNTTTEYVISEPFTWSYDLPRPYSRFIPTVFVKIIRERYQGQVDSPVIRPISQRNAVLNVQFEGLEFQFADAIWSNEFSGPEEPLVPRPQQKSDLHSIE